MKTFTSTILGIATVLSLSAFGCASDAVDDDNALQEGDVVASEAELKAEQEDFSALDASDEELAKASHAAKVFDNEFTLYAIAAPKLVGLSWKSPGALARRVLANEGLGASNAIGHVQIGIDCAATATKPAVHIETGQSNVGDDFRKMVMGEKAGLGVMFRTIPGELQTAEDALATLDKQFGKGRATFVRNGVSSETCHALVDYVREYQARGVYKNYGFVRPSYQEGSGCSAFGMSAVKLANLLEPYMENEWKFDVKIPMSLIGGTTNPGNRVGVLRLLLLGRPWAREGEPHLRLNGWDPTLMYKSIQQRAREGIANGSVTVQARGRSLGIVVDRRNVKASSLLLSGTYFKGEPSTTDVNRFRTADF
ncbi:MAG: hypothetical protein U0174_11245 [Polyangiaceae bacterium]